MLASLVVIPAILTGCGDDTEEIPEAYRYVPKPKKGGDRKIITDIEGDTRKSVRKRSKTVKPAAELRSNDFRLAYVRNSYRQVARGQQIILDMLAFKKPSRGLGGDDELDLGEDEVPEWLPLDRKALLTEALHFAQRSPRAVRNRYFKDLEIFLVFKAAYESLNPEDRASLVRRWMEDYGSEIPEVSKDREAPLYWLRTNEVFWERGGRFWWWAGNALLTDPGFRVEEDGRVIIDLKESKRIYTS